MYNIPLQTYTANYYPSPEIDEEDGEDGEVEVIIIKRRKGKKVPIKVTPFEPFPKPDIPQKPWVYKGPMPKITWADDTPCMFDGLPPGAYLISCPCPRHRVIC